MRPVFSMYWWVGRARLQLEQDSGLRRRWSRSSTRTAGARSAMGRQQVDAIDTRVPRCTHRAQQRAGPHGSMRPQRTRGGARLSARMSTDIVGRCPAWAGATAPAPAEAGHESRTQAPNSVRAAASPSAARRTTLATTQLAASVPSAIALLFWAQCFSCPHPLARRPSPCAPSHPEIHDPWGAHRLQPPYSSLFLSRLLHRPSVTHCILAR
jgi:hypothetical protein